MKAVKQEGNIEEGQIQDIPNYSPTRLHNILRYLIGLVRSKIWGLNSADCPLASSVFTDKLMAEWGKMAPGVEKG